MENCGSAVMSVISFLRGQLINHDTPSTRQSPGRNLIAPLSDPQIHSTSLFYVRRAVGDKASPAITHPSNDRLALLGV
jgi:hypothetical protein